jgi:release factor glutamine methyltransferase
VTALDKLKQISQLFSELEAPQREAEILITGALDINRAALYSQDLEISKEASEKIDAFADRRLKGEPMSYIIGHVEFHGLRIQVGKGVLIPRPETELMVEEAVKAIRTQNPLNSGQQTATSDKQSAISKQVSSISGQQAASSGQADPANHKPGLTIVDLCTGSGCIALALAKMLPQSVVYGIDKSDIALSYARGNSEINRIKNVIFAKGNLFEPLGYCLSFDFIISNPPYIRRGDIDKLQIEIREHEPRAALDGGEDGLDFYRRIIRDAPGFMKDKGLLILEIGADQADDIRKLAADAGFKDIQFIKDYSGIERIFVGRLASLIE